MLSEVAENTNEQAKGQKEKNERIGTEEQEQDSKERKNKSGKQRTKDQEQKNKNRKTRTERQEPRQRTEEQDQKTRRAPTRTKDKANAKQRQDDHHANAKPTTPPRTPTPVLGSRHKQNNKTSNRHSCCRPNCTRPFGPRSVVTSTIPALDRAGYTLILFFLPRPSPSPLWGGRGRRQSNKQNKNNELKYKPSMPPSISKQKEKEIHKETTRQ